MSNTKRIIACFTFICYIFAVIYFTLFTARRLSHHGYSTPHFVPVVSLFTEIFEPPKYNVKGHYTEVVENFFGNILLFIPFGFLMNFIKGKIKTVLLAAIFFSASIEITQLIFKLGVCDINDVLLNTLGAYVGFKFYNLLLKNICND